MMKNNDILKSLDLFPILFCVQPSLAVPTLGFSSSFTFTEPNRIFSRYGYESANI